MQAQIEIQAVARSESGKGIARAARRAGFVPAVLYANKKGNVNLSVDAQVLTLEYRKGGFLSKIVALKTDKETYHVVPREVQLNPVSDKIEHADFQLVDAKSEVKVRVPVHFIGAEKSIGIKRGGVLSIISRQLQLLCNVNAIPKAIEIDLTGLNIGQSVHINDLKLPEGSRSAYKNRNVTVCSMTGRGKDEEEKPAAEAAAAAPAAGAAPAAAAKPAAKK